jgi:hypothetical protein
MMDPGSLVGARFPGFLRLWRNFLAIRLGGNLPSAGGPDGRKDIIEVNKFLLYNYPQKYYRKKPPLRPSALTGFLARWTCSEWPLGRELPNGSGRGSG